MTLSWHIDSAARLSCRTVIIVRKHRRISNPVCRRTSCCPRFPTNESHRMSFRTRMAPKATPRVRIPVLNPGRRTSTFLPLDFLRQQSSRTVNGFLRHGERSLLSCRASTSCCATLSHQWESPTTPGYLRSEPDQEAYRILPSRRIVPGSDDLRWRFRSNASRVQTSTSAAARTPHRHS